MAEMSTCRRIVGLTGLDWHHVQETLRVNSIVTLDEENAAIVYFFVGKGSFIKGWVDPNPWKLVVSRNFKSREVRSLQSSRRGVRCRPNRFHAASLFCAWRDGGYG